MGKLLFIVLFILFWKHFNVFGVFIESQYRKYYDVRMFYKRHKLEYAKVVFIVLVDKLVIESVFLKVL